MKQFFFTALLPFFYLLYSFFAPFSPPAYISRAEDYSYAYVPTEHVYLYSDVEDASSRRGLFRLPCTYYVRILSSAGEYYRVEYLSDGKSTRQVRGYCKKSELIPVDYTPAVPYLYKTLELTYTLPDASGKDGSLSLLKLTCAYYGDYTDGTDAYCYVLLNDEFGYIPRPANFSFERNTEYESRHQTVTPPAKTPQTESAGMAPGQIALLVLLCLLVPAIAALILRPSKRPPYETEE
ncbi:MAG: hypothetical protein IJY62_05590 [Clostridia bacterium]|nr:hypothetical protein [Clostridia bacterium]